MNSAMVLSMLLDMHPVTVPSDAGFSTLAELELLG